MPVLRRSVGPRSCRPCSPLFALLTLLSARVLSCAPLFQRAVGAFALGGATARAHRFGRGAAPALSSEGVPGGGGGGWALVAAAPAPPRAGWLQGGSAGSPMATAVVAELALAVKLLRGRGRNAAARSLASTVLHT